MYRTLSTARACSSCPTGRIPYGVGASLPVTTATTPSNFSARRVSMCLMRAWGKGECRILPTSMPGMVRSSVYLPAPVVLPAASTMAMGFPIIEKASLVIGRSSLAKSRPSCRKRVQDYKITLFNSCHSLLFGINRGFDGLIHLAIARATAKIAAKRAANLGSGRIRISRQYVFHCHDETRSTETTLRASPVAIGFLDGGQTAVFAHTFDGSDLLSFATGSQHCARQHRNP